MPVTKKKILLITVRADHGGGPKHIHLLIKLLSPVIDFFVACPNEEPYFNIFADIVGKDRIFTIPHRKFNMFKLSKLKHIIKKNDINIIHSHGKGAGIYGRLLSRSVGTICIHTFHGIHLGEYNFIIKYLYLSIERYLARYTSKFITVSDSEKDKVLSLRITPNNKVSVISNGIELMESKVSSEIFSRPKLNVITITRFDFAKNSQLIIPILNQIKHKGMLDRFEIQLIGDGPDSNWVKSLAVEKELSDNLKFLGMIDSPMNYLINSFCYISTSRWEGLPLGLMEAMSVGLPVIATNVNGNKDLVEHSVNGFLFNIDKPEEAADYIIQLSNDKELWGQFSKNARSKIIKSYSAEKMAEKTKQLYLSDYEVN